MSLGCKALEAVLAELQPLCGRRVQRLWAPGASTIVLRLRDASAQHDLAIEIAHPRARLGVVKDRPRAEAGAWQRKLRDAIEGRVLESMLQVVEGDRVISLSFRAGEGRRTLLVELLGGRSQTLLLDEAGLMVGAAFPQRLASRGLALGAPWQAPRASARAGEGSVPDLSRFVDETFPISAALEAHYAPLDRAAGTHEVRRQLRQTLARARRRARNTRAKLEQRMGAASQVDALRQQGELLKPALGRFRRGETEVLVQDWSDPTGEPVHVVLDPKLGPRENLEAIFKRARRLEHGARIAETSLREVIACERQLAELFDAVDATDGVEGLELLWRSARALGVKRPAPPSSGKRRKVIERLPYRTFVGSAGTLILVGRSARDNHALTFKVARGRDLWLHVRDHPGSHVVIRQARGAALNSETLLEAGLLAAHFSEGREAGVVDVSWTERKHIHHPPGAAKGLVSMARAHTLRVIPDPERLALLFQSEQQNR